jgi:hypothetical protein
MSTTLSNGYIKPDTGDKGSSFFPALEANIQRVNDHTHNGTNSEKLPPTALTLETQAIVNTSWASVGNGLFSASVALPTNYLYDERQMFFRDTDDGAPYMLRYAKVDANNMTVFINDNTKNVTVYYL